MNVNSVPQYLMVNATHSLEREFYNYTEKQALIRGWLDLCQHEHGDTCNESHGTYEEHLRLVGETYFGEIDVVDVQHKALLVDKESGRPARYVALSYVWGSDRKGSRYMTTKTTVMTHIRRCLIFAEGRI
ncbi:hypothetical protein GGR53DRAFT_4294 [Hypoxylon sp. FL1150]|nr:hypothetical protein GGR53DRAFT_4294 [Hypoxylon sp. FL1150]